MFSYVEYDPEREKIAGDFMSIISRRIYELAHELFAQHGFNMDYIQIQVEMQHLSPRESSEPSRSIFREITESLFGAPIKPRTFVFSCYMYGLYVVSDIYAFPKTWLAGPIDVASDIPLEIGEDDLIVIADEFFESKLREKVNHYALEQKAIQVARELL